MNSAFIRSRMGMTAAAAVVGLSTSIATPAFADSESGSTRLVTRHTKAGQEVAIRGFAEVDSDCRLRSVPPITVIQAPAHGTVDTRPEKVVNGKNWVGNAACEGTEHEGERVYYKPADGFVGTDHFSFNVQYRRNQPVRAEVEVIVEAAP